MSSIQKRGLICGVLGAASWGASGTCGQFLFQNYPVDSFWLTAFRMSCSGAILFALSWLRQKNELKRFLTDRRSLAELAAFSVFGLLLSQLAYLTAIQYSNAGTATVLQSLSIVLITILFYIRRRTLPPRMQLLAILLAFLGIFFVATQGNPATLAITPRGLIWGLAAAAGAAGYCLLSGSLIDRWGNTAVCGSGMLIGGLVFSLVIAVWKLPPLDLRGWLLIACIILLGTVIAYTLFLQCIHDLGPVNGNLLAGIEPLTATALSAFLLHSRFTAADLIGFVCILGAAAMLNLTAQSDPV